MRTSLRLCIALLLVVIVQGYSIAQTVSTNIGSLTNLKTGITRDFTVTTEGNGQNVNGKLTFSPFVTNNIVLQYMAPGATQFSNLAIDANGVALFGPITLGSSVTHNFRILFNTGKNYNYTLGLVDASNSSVAVGSSVSGALNVATFQEPTIDGTLDVIDNNEPGIVASQDYEWTIFVTSNNRVGEKANIQIVLENPALRDNVTLMYDANRAITNGGTVNYQPLTFNEAGVATIGPTGGEELTSGIEQLMKVNFSQPGSYAYTIQLLRDDNNPIATVKETITVTSVAGIDDMIGNTRISVYPTLSTGSLTVDLGNVRNANITITDVLGRGVMQLDNASGILNLNTNNLAKGTYFVKVIKGNDVAGSRFIVR